MKMQLWKQVLIGLFFGVVAGICLGESTVHFKILGTLFMNMIKMVMVPLIFFAILSGITSMNGGGNVTRVGIKAFTIYLFTSIFAVLIGLVAGSIFEPGVGIDMQSLLEKAGTLQSMPVKEIPTIIGFLVDLIPTNPIKSMANDSFLQIIIFSVFLGIIINTVGDGAKPVRDIINSCSKIMLQMISVIIKFAPVGVFGYMSWVVGTQGIGIIISLIKLIVTLLVSCTVQYVICGILIIVFARLNPIPFYKKMLFTQSVAFSTSSSKATLSTAMTQIQQKLGVSKTNCDFLMPLGVCVNMDGTALYLGICAVFFSQAYGIDLTFDNYLVLVLLCTLGSIGAAGIPSGSIIFMGMVLSSVGIPIEGIGIILGVDRILDMIRTVINITGDSMVVLIVDKSEKCLNEDIYYDRCRPL